MIEQRRVASRDTKLYMTELQEFFNAFGSSPYEELDWSTDWKAKLNERWQYFHPDAVILKS